MTNPKGIFLPDDTSRTWIPIYSASISCGLFGITDDFIEGHLSLDEKFTKNKNSCFYIRASGDSMEPQIYNEDILVVDCSIKPTSGAIVAVFFNSSPICKQFFQKKDSLILHSLNSNYQDIIIKEEDDFQIFGTVIALARDLK